MVIVWSLWVVTVVDHVDKIIGTRVICAALSEKDQTANSRTGSVAGAGGTAFHSPSFCAPSRLR